jgi:hypothetical protein
MKPRFLTGWISRRPYLSKGRSRARIPSSRDRGEIPTSLCHIEWDSAWDDENAQKNAGIDSFCLWKCPLMRLLRRE